METSHSDNYLLATTPTIGVNVFIIETKNNQHRHKLFSNQYNIIEKTNTMDQYS